MTLTREIVNTENPREYRGLVDRREFKCLRNGGDPWVREPDLVVGTYRGYSYAIIRMPDGHLNGYGAVPEGHTYFGVDYDELNVRVHGGLTFCKGDLGGGLFDVTTPGGSKVWWLGFDTGHAFDYRPRALWCMYAETEYRTYGYVYEEVLNLIRQFSEVGGGGPNVMPVVVFLAALED